LITETVYFLTQKRESNGGKESRRVFCSCSSLFVLYRYGFKSGEEIVLSNAERNVSTLSLLIERVGGKKNLKIPKLPTKCLLFGLLLLCSDVETCPGPEYSIGTTSSLQAKRLITHPPKYMWLTFKL